MTRLGGRQSFPDVPLPGAMRGEHIRHYPADPLHSVLSLPLRLGYSSACINKLEKQNKIGTDYAALILKDILDECSTLTEASSRDGCDLAVHFGFANSPLLALVYLLTELKGRQERKPRSTFRLAESSSVTTTRSRLGCLSDARH
ncbi:hypothetical protein B0H13DRAFT_1857206 [Mycena leptocephala]|nr:hypothetical protein B0H13DRAFT_1857206 [Mycena leptocephala]